MEAFLLGLSSGVVCLAYCAPVLVPCLMAGSGSTARTVGVVLRFLAGRLLGYLLFGLAAWGISESLLRSGYRESIIGLAYMVLAVALVLYGFLKERRPCTGSCAEVFGAPTISDRPRLSFLVPALAGLATGLNLCPPFLLAMAAAAQKGSLPYSLLFFFLFFLGTSLFLVPAPLFGLLKPFPAIRTVGRLAAGLMGVYYFISGLIMVAGGIKSL
ncbi:MAG: sulfite exporter TauE/SafE family protein [Syntrophorhabdales bacterium]|jgi:sulfite exporter TauE/SafE